MKNLNNSLSIYQKIEEFIKWKKRIYFNLNLVCVFISVTYSIFMIIGLFLGLPLLKSITSFIFVVWSISFFIFQIHNWNCKKWENYKILCKNMNVDNINGLQNLVTNKKINEKFFKKFLSFLEKNNK